MTTLDVTVNVRRDSVVPPYGTDAWVEWRRGGLGASDIPAILGLDPYRTEHDVWEEKTGRRPAFTGNAKTRWGHRLEHVGLDVWAEAHQAQPVANDEPYQLPEWPHLWATPDGIDPLPGQRVGIEVKVTDNWVNPPERVRVQCLVQAGLGDLVRVDVVRLSFDEDPAIFRIERDDAAIGDILAAGEAWYVHHVLGDVEPPRKDGETPADERQAQLAADLRRVKRAIEQLERQERAIRDDLVASVAGQGVITGAGFRIEVTRTRGAIRTGWKEVAAEYRVCLGLNGYTPDDLDGIEGKYQTQGDPQTRLTPKWDEEE